MRAVDAQSSARTTVKKAANVAGKNANVASRNTEVASRNTNVVNRSTNMNFNRAANVNARAYVRPAT